jgi:hypothetical protein
MALIDATSHPWVHARRLLGGLIMFVIEGAIVAGLAVVALIVSSVILAIL